jgi:hypothetical protein
MLLFNWVRENFGTGPTFETGKIPGMIEVTVSEQNRLDGLGGEAKLFQLPADKKHFAEQSGVEHHTVIAIRQQETAAHDTANDMQVGRIVAHT